MGYLRTMDGKTSNVSKPRKVAIADYEKQIIVMELKPSGANTEQHAHGAMMNERMTTPMGSVVESWIADSTSQDKAYALGLDVDQGAWYGLVKVKNEETFKELIRSYPSR